ncbi:MAG: hypothetical protein WBB82_15020 [Limnothrix sp.]
MGYCSVWEVIMGSDRRRHSFYSSPDTPLRAVVDDLQNAPGQALQRELADLLLILRYPYVLQRLDAPPQQVTSQTRESIRRLEQEISALKTLLAAYSSLGDFRETEKAGAIAASSDAFSDGDSQYVHDNF